MSQAIFIEGTHQKQCPGLPRVCMDVVASTAVCYLPKEFSSPMFEYEDVEPQRVAQQIDCILQWLYDDSVNVQRQLIKFGECKTREDFDKTVLEFGLDRCEKKIMQAGEFAFSHPAAKPLAATAAGLLERKGFNDRAARLRNDLEAEVSGLKTLEMSFRKYQNSKRSDAAIFEVNEKGESAAYIGEEGPRWCEGAPNQFNLITKIVRDGFGELKDKVKLHFSKDNCECLYNGRVIMSCGPKVSEGLEVFRDAAIWIWLDVLLRYHQAEMRKSWFARLRCSKPKVEETDEIVDWSETNPLIERSPSAITLSAATEDLVNERYLMPEPSIGLAPVVSALKKVGFAQEVDDFVRTNRFVKAASDPHTYDLELPDGTRPRDFRQEGKRWFWYYTLMEKLRSSKLFVLPALDL